MNISLYNCNFIMHEQHMRMRKKTTTTAIGKNKVADQVYKKTTTIIGKHKVAEIGAFVFTTQIV